MHDQRTLLRRAYADGEALASIVERFDCSLSTIYRAIGKQRRRTFGPSAETLSKVHVLTQAGLTHKQIGRALGLGRHRVLAEMRKARASAPRDELTRLREENRDLRSALEAVGCSPFPPRAEIFEVPSEGLARSH
jgi:hypothetical protein